MGTYSCTWADSSHSVETQGGIKPDNEVNVVTFKLQICFFLVGWSDSFRVPHPTPLITSLNTGTDANHLNNSLPFVHEGSRSII